MRVLFVCNQGEHRSRTARKIFKGRFETDSAGLYSEKALSKEQLAWADVVAVMEEQQRQVIGTRFSGIYLQKRIVCLDIPDIFHYGQPELIALLEQQARAIL